MMLALTILAGGLLVSSVGLYFVRENFRRARTEGVIYIRGARYERKDSEFWFGVAYWINWLTAGIFAAAGIAAVVLAVLISMGKM
jgi:hypothetical protein